MLFRSTVGLQRRVAEVLDLVHLRGFDSRRVTDLSGGEAQRVALARALAPRPRLLMFDEPLGALDRALKENLLIELRDILRRTKIPAIYVTHDQEEAFALADRVLLLHNGHIVREGTPEQVWDHPRTGWAARFLGAGNIVDGQVVKVQGSKSTVQTDIGDLQIRCAHNHKVNERVSLLLKADSSTVGRGAAGAVRIKARVEESLFQRDQFQVRLRGGLVVAMKSAPKVGSQISARFVVECLGDE